jgi:thiol-disulfide isomerase/thioredoxin
MKFFYEIKNASYRNCHLIIFGLIIIILLIFLFVINSNNNTNNADEQFDDISNNKLVLYYASWCEWSQQFLPIWEIFKQKYPEIITETIECKNNNCTTIKGYPTIIYYKNNTPLLYTGNRTVDDLYQFVVNQNSQDIDDTYNENNNIKNNNTNKKIVLYHAEWCGHCKNFLPVWKQFVKQYPEINVEDIECSNEGNKSKCANIEGFPTVILFKDDQQIQYNGERTIDGLLNFVQNN